VKLVEKYCPQRQTCSGSDCMENHRMFILTGLTMQFLEIIEYFFKLLG
jgi:hypothetical protein